jgi:hypothetical protein
MIAPRDLYEEPNACPNSHVITGLVPVIPMD